MKIDEISFTFFGYFNINIRFIDIFKNYMLRNCMNNQLR